MIKKLIFVSICIASTALGALAQDWSEYSRGSSEWHRHNRDAMFRPWKYDRGGRLKRGNHYSSGRHHSGRHRHHR